ncbi:TDA11 [Candida pseudojiufengensis]|uniref:TDA11 n=1 Tax=Candida pseudojiufengensis TaxID=497109 RepID=UPI002224DA68|nr:TDA11 [Candida pseudojiufengensis]KAI5965775.1 TDA11 [Candida pseudojiufengensis]
MTGVNSTLNNNQFQYDTTTNKRDKTPSPSKEIESKNKKIIQNGKGPIQFKVRRSSTISNDNNPNITTESKSKITPSKGLNIFAVSPINQTTPNSSLNSSNATLTEQTIPTSSSSSNNGTNDQLKNRRSKSPTDSSRFDFKLPSKEELKLMDIDDQLRILALKEMIIVQIKDEISNLQAKLGENENELHELREIVQRSLYQGISNNVTTTTTNNNNKTLGRQRTNSNPRDQAIESIKNKRRSSSGAGIPIYEEEKNSEDNGSNKSKLWSGLSKPFNLLQQFDNLLQNEFEKSLTLDTKIHQKQQQNHQHQPRNSEDSINSIGSINSPLRTKSQTTLSEYKNSLDRKSDDMIQTVSSSIWSFVNDVKLNVLSSLNEEENSDFNSNLSLDEEEEDNDNDDEKIDFSIYKN